MLHVIAYDIADPGRLRRVARVMERWALRCQKSVFVLRGDRPAVVRLLDEITPLLKLDQDRVQAWKLAAEESLVGMVRGYLVPLEPACVVAGSGPHRFVDGSAK